jgi:hypothetical protein
VDESLEISMSKKANEDAFFAKWMKQRQAQGISLKKRIIGREKEGTKKIVKKRKVTKEGDEGEDEEGMEDGGKKKGKKGKKGTKGVEGGTTSDNRANEGRNDTYGGQDTMGEIREGDDFEDNEGGNNNNGSNTIGTSKGAMYSGNRKTMASKKIRELQEKTLQADQFAGTLKVENKRVRKDLDVHVVSAKTIEALMKFLGIEPDDSRYGLDNKLNKVRIEIQGQKPTKIKKQLKPNSKNDI